MNTATDNKPLILLVDDQPANLHVLAAALKADYRLCFAKNGAEGLDVARREESPQLILLDVQMPVMNGIEMLRALRADADTQDIPVIFISGDTSEQSQLDGLDLGADDYLTKPVVNTVLLARVRNLLQRKQAETQLRLASHVFEHCGEAIMVTDRNNHIVEVNPAFTRLTGYLPEEVCGKNPRILSSGRNSREHYVAMWAEIRAHGFWQGELWDRNKDGVVYPKLLTITVVKNRRGEIDFHIASFANISTQKAAEEHAQHQAHHDALTGLPNRLGLSIGLQQLLAMARREAKEIALMFIDLDRFKAINDTLGHNVGDSLLVEVARRLKECLRETDLVGRIGGDEFIVVIGGGDADKACGHVAQKILDHLGQCYELHGHAVRTTPSIGISLFPHDGTDEDALMKSADVAMYHAKSLGRNNFQFFQRNDESGHGEVST